MEAKLSIDDYVGDLEEVALRIALQAKAVAYCKWDSEVLVDQGD